MIPDVEVIRQTWEERFPDKPFFVEFAVGHWFELESGSEKQLTKTITLKEKTDDKWQQKSKTSRRRVRC